MNNWIESIYSDTSIGFVDNPAPSIGNKVTITIRFLNDSSKKSVFIMKMVNGAENYVEMQKTSHRLGNLIYYKAEVEVTEPRFAYHFVIARDDVIYYYTQAGVTTYVPDNADNFVLLADDHWPCWVNDAVFYQIFPAAFGGLSGVREHIPYLKRLGVNAIYLNPIFRAPSDHKYDCVDYFHVDENFGGDEALVKLSKELHENDMKLILDISINHTGIEHPWVKEKRHFYFKKEDGSLEGWAGFDGLPILDYRNEELRDIIYRSEDSVLRKWLKPPYCIDGWRFDVADVFARHGDVQLADEVWREVCDAIREENHKAFIIGEHWGNCDEYLQGDLWNTPMNYYGYGRIIRQFLGLPELFVSRCEKLAKIPYRMTAHDVVERTREHYRHLPGVIARSQMNLFDSHDVPRIHNYEDFGLNKVRMAVISELMWTGIPCVYYGDEVGIDGYTHHDSGFRFNMPKKLPEKTGDNPYYDLYKWMIDLRRNEPAFIHGGRKVVYAEGYILAVARFYEDRVFLGVLSMEKEPRHIEISLECLGINDVALDIEPESGELIRVNDHLEFIDTKV